jgi:hypothetical protein
MNFLNSKGKKLFIQLQDVTFDSARYPVPKYILQILLIMEEPTRNIISLMTMKIRLKKQVG